MKKNLKGKKLGIYLYDSKNMLIKSKISTIKSKHISKVKITKKQAIKKLTRNTEADKYSVKITNAVLKKGNFLMPYYWKVTYTVPPEDDWIDDVYIDATSGKTFNPVFELV